jgi:heme-degrading monooxygenase HmoA
MPTLPWAVVDRPDTSGAVVMASRFKLRTWRHVLPFFLDSMRIHRQVRRAAGAYGVTLSAHPLRREFLTLSSWRDDAAIKDLVRAEPHRSVMRKYRAATEEATFRFWSAPAAEPPTWAEARSRLAQPESDS